jgi:preprotein translocase subunit SecD
MEIIEEMTIGPAWRENIAKGFHSVAWGFAAICAFMAVYYMLFGMFSEWRWRSTCCCWWRCCRCCRPP